MARSIPVNWHIHIPEPVEVKMVSPTLQVRDAISPLERYKGLFTYCLEDDTFYYLSEGITNSHWKPIGKPQAIVIYDEFQDGPQQVISGQGLKKYLEQHYYTREEVDQKLAGIKIPDWIESVTPEQVEAWNQNKGDISERRDFDTPQTVWQVSHPEGKTFQTFNLQGAEIVGKKVNVNSKLTFVYYSKPIAGYALIN